MGRANWDPFVDASSTKLAVTEGLDLPTAVEGPPGELGGEGGYITEFPGDFGIAPATGLRLVEQLARRADTVETDLAALCDVLEDSQTPSLLFEL